MKHIFSMVVATIAFCVEIVHATTQLVAGSGTYMIIDLSDGTGATNYPVSYLASEPPGGWTDEYKTTKLVLRRIAPGTFTMGSPTNEIGRWEEYETQHQVSISKPFYMGIFEVTQKQFELVMGSNPSRYKGDTRPVEFVTYTNIRGTSSGMQWPISNAVDTTSFMGRLRTRTRCDAFDLPTEAQWEYACRAGTTTALNSGKNLISENSDSNMEELGRYYYNRNDGKGGYADAHTTVGSYLPNAWGLYDMHGNVSEWCLDWWQTSLGTTAVTDPLGSESGSYRVNRGGAWNGYAKVCRSALRYGGGNPHAGNYDIGFRLCCSAEPDRDKVQLWEGGPYWATMNIGAEKPEDYGLYFWWGDTVGYRRENDAWVASDGSSQTFSPSKINIPTYNKSIATLQSEGWITTDNVLATEHDAAQAHWGGAWRMPTDAEFSALNNNCDWTWITTNGVNGYVVRGRGNYASASIFLPAAGYGSESHLLNCDSYGYYWSSLPYSDLNSHSWILKFDSSNQEVSWNNRDDMRSIRPVQGTYITVTLSGNGGTPSAVSISGFAGNAYVTLPTATRNGYDFTGWFTAPEGGIQVTVSSLFDESVTTLYAHWTANAPISYAKVQLWEGGPYWATMNIGAEKPEDYGLYFWWGDTVGYKRENGAWVASDGSSQNFSFCSGNTPTYNKSNATLQSEGWTTAENILAPEHDAAHVHWGGAWRMPTCQELSELCDNCDWTFTTTNGMRGFIVHGRGSYADTSIFLPAAGYGTGTSLNSPNDGYGVYWSSESRLDSCISWNLTVTSRNHDMDSNYDRYYGQFIRPVQGTCVIVTFDGNGGTPSAASMSGIAGDEYGTLLTATREGYDFAGWFTAATGGTQVTASSLFDETVTTLYAHWTANNYTITFDSAGGSAVAPITAAYGSSLTEPATPTRDGYTFAGWTPTFPATMPLDGATLTAQWTANSYTVTFDSAGGSAVASIIAAYGSALAEPAAPTRDGYMFAGWSPAFPATMPLDGATLTAQWTANSYTVTFNANGGTGGWTKSLDCGSAIVAPKVTRAGYVFAGWTPAVSATVPVGGATYVAKWTPITYKVAFNANGGKGKMAAQKMTYGKAAKLTKNVFTRKGYVFAGWAKSKADAKKGVIAFANAAAVKNLSAKGGTVTLYAVWAKPAYKVAFYANGGTGKTVVQAFKYGKAAKLAACKFKAPKGRKFVGWATSAANAKKGVVKFKNKQAVKNLIITGKTVKLYAVWKKK